MKRTLFVLSFLLLSVVSFGQGDPLSYLRKQCPQLTELYKTELENCHAHYIMAVDVSLSMAKYEEDVLPALKSFIGALPDGDRVTLIPFAKNANDNKMGFDVEITGETRNSLLQILGSLYPHGEERRDKQYYDTDIFEAQQAVVRSVQQNAQYDVNIIIFITDMMHCPSNNIDRQFSEGEVNQMETLLKSARGKAENRLFTLALPKSGKPEGYVYPTLAKLYKDNWEEDLISVEVPSNSEALIRQWFEKQKDRIMFTKLQAVIIPENKANPIYAKTNIDIDGNVTAEVRWRAGKLYPKMTIDSTYFDKGNFTFISNKEYEHFSSVGELDEDALDLGKIKSKNLFFNKLADTLHFDVSLPVPYQDEIIKLLEGRPTPDASVKEYVDRWIWTFFLPLWLTATILAILIIYIILVLAAAARNAKVSFDGQVSVSTIDGEDVLTNRRISSQKSFAVGSAGDNGMRIPADWNLTVRRKLPSPFAIFRKTVFVWSKSAGYVSTSGRRPKTSGIISASSTILKVDGGPAKGDITHKITIKYFPKK